MSGLLGLKRGHGAANLSTSGLPPKFFMALFFFVLFENTEAAARSGLLCGAGDTEDSDPQGPRTSPHQEQGRQWPA